MENGVSCHHALLLTPQCHIITSLPFSFFPFSPSSISPTEPTITTPPSLTTPHHHRCQLPPTLSMLETKSSKRRQSVHSGIHILRTKQKTQPLSYNQVVEFYQSSMVFIQFNYISSCLLSYWI